MLRLVSPRLLLHRLIALIVRDIGTLGQLLLLFFRAVISDELIASLMILPSLYVLL